MNVTRENEVGHLCDVSVQDVGDLQVIWPYDVGDWELDVQVLGGELGIYCIMDSSSLWRYWRAAAQVFVD